MQNNLKRSKHLGKYVSSAVLLIVCLLLLFPLIWGVISSFRDANDLRFYPGSFLPTNVKAWTIQNYIAIFLVKNTLYSTGLSIALLSL